MLSTKLQCYTNHRNKCACVFDQKKKKHITVAVCPAICSTIFLLSFCVCFFSSPFRLVPRWFEFVSRKNLQTTCTVDVHSRRYCWDSYDINTNLTQTNVQPNLKLSIFFNCLFSVYPKLMIFITKKNAKTNPRGLFTK